MDKTLNSMSIFQPNSSPTVSDEATAPCSQVADGSATSSGGSASAGRADLWGAGRDL